MEGHAREAGRPARRSDRLKLTVQESERPYERGSTVTGAEQRDVGRWMCDELVDGNSTGASAQKRATQTEVVRMDPTRWIQPDVTIRPTRTHVGGAVNA